MRPIGNNPDIQNFIRSIDAGAEKMLLLPVGVVSHMGQQIGGVSILAPFGLDAPPGKLHCRQKQRRFGIANTIETA